MLDTNNQDPLFEVQKELEQFMRDSGVEGYRQRVRSAIERGQEGTTSYGLMMMKRSVDDLANMIEGFVQDALGGKVSKSPYAAVLLNHLDSEVSAYIALKFCMDGVSIVTPLTRLAMRIANALEDQFKLEFYKRQDQFMFNKIYKTVTNRTTNRYYRRYNMLRECNRLELTAAQPWSSQEKLALGTKLVDMVVQATGLIKVESQSIKTKRKVLFVRATETTLDWITKVNERGEELSASYMPCVVKPKDWTTPINGGYYTPELFKIPMIKTSNLNYFEDMKYFPMPEEYNAINALQASRFTVNDAVLEVMKEAWESGQEWGKLPPREDYSIPPFPFAPDVDTASLSIADRHKFMDWKKAATSVYQTNARIMSKRLALVRTMKVAEKYSEFDEIFFVYQNDFRFRKYVCSSFLNPQGSDPTKALLHFAEGKPLGKKGAYWLGIQGANTWGNDKVSLLDRYSWAVSNTSWIVECANDPFGNPKWCKADKPWQFLAFCFEWKGYQEEGSQYLSRIPVALDGCNNGIQHLSALARDLRGAEATNLLPSALPKDIYQDVADEVIKVLKTRTDDMAKLWLKFGIDRGLTKRPVMVVPYGGRLFSCRGYIEEAMVTKIQEGAEDVFDGKHFDASDYLSRILWDAISEVVVSARKVMAWIQEVATALSKAGFPMSWQTPTGAHVTQNYEEVLFKRVVTFIDGALLKPRVREKVDGSLDRRRSVNGSSPNFIHSLDSAAMTKTINLCKQRGLSDFCMIHDSYAVHAGELEDGRNCTEILFDALREAFVEMYETHNPLEELRQAALEVIDDVPEVPAMGALDIKDVLKSEYFFS